MTTDTPRAGRREWIGLAVIALPCLLYSMDLTVLNLAVPHLSADLRPSSTQLLWIVDIYGFIVAGSLITMGTLGDRIGRRRLLMIGAAAFGAASVLAAFSTSAEMLIAGRALLGVAGATLAPSTLSLIFTMFLDPKQRSTAIGVWIAAYSAGGAIGPVLGGVLLEFFWWGSVFLIGVPVMVLLLALGPRLLPESRDPDAGRLDLVSAGLSLAAVLAAIYGLKEMVKGGVGWPYIVAGLAVGAIFLRRQARLTDPLIDLGLFKGRAFGAALATNTFGFFAAFGSLLFIAQYLQLVLGLSPLEAGLWSLPSSAGFLAGAMLAPVILRRVRPAYLMAGGLALAAVGFAVITQVGGLALLVIGSTVFALGLSPVAAVATDLIVGAAPPERAGAASAMSETSSELGGALGIAVLGSVASASYRGTIDLQGLPLPDPVATAARESVGAATVLASQVPGGAEIARRAGEAFTSAFNASSLASMVVVLAAAAVVAVSFGRRAEREAADDQLEEEPDAEMAA